MQEKIIMTKAKHASEAMKASWIHHLTDTDSINTNNTNTNAIMTCTLPQGRMYIIFCW
jgi:hypothetical protein